MAIYYSKLFEDNFATDPDQDPLNPALWTPDVDTEDFGNLVVTNGKCVGDAASVSNGQGGEYWNGNAPNDGYVQFTVGAITTDQIQVIYRLQTPLSFFGSGGYRAGITFINSIQYEIACVNLTTHTGPFDIMIDVVNPGDIFIFAFIGETHYVFQNGVLLASGDDSVADGGYITAGVQTSGLFVGYQPSDMASAQSFTNVQMGAASTTPFPSGHWSPVDSRVNKPNSATFRTVNGAQIDDVQTSSNAAVPGVDSRKAGAPVACGTYPQNSRTAPPFKS